jgi:hypothetical protein
VYSAQKNKSQYYLLRQQQRHLPLLVQALP